MATSRSGPDESGFSDTALDALIGDTTTPEELGALFRRLQKRLAERMLAGEVTAHVGYAAGEAKPAGQSNHRNGSSAKTVRTETGVLPLDIPRDRAGTFTPQLVPKGVRRLPQFDANVRSLDARSTRGG
jgi:transposase-like protein